MPTSWGVFLCNCRRTLDIDPQQLDSPADLIYSATHPDTDAQTFVTRAQAANCQQILVGCCTPPSDIDAIFTQLGASISPLHVVNLRESCFWVHEDGEQAHDKASRLLQAAMQRAERQAEPAYLPLNAGERILIVGDAVQGAHLARQLREVAQPIGIVPASPDRAVIAAFVQVYHGHVAAVEGRLGDFQVHVAAAGSSSAAPRVLHADQIVFLTPGNTLSLKSRTGLYLLSDPSPEELDHTATRVRDLIGNFLKVIHVDYQADICAGGAAGHEACGRCIEVCPYDSIQRDPQNHLRVQVNQMSCEGCGACTSACPTSALRFADPSPRELYAQLTELLKPRAASSPTGPPVILFHCGEQGQRTLDEAGRLGLSYPAQILPVAVPCLRYVSAATMLAAFQMGAAGVGLLGCAACPHGERELLYQHIETSQLILEAFGLASDRLHLSTADAGAEPEVISDLVRFVDRLDPAPLTWDGQWPRHSHSRDVIASAIAALIDQTGREPGSQAFKSALPFAVTTVQESGCTLCRSCINVCPTHAFRFDAASESLQLKQVSCVACGLCETACPENVIQLQPEIPLSRPALDYQSVVHDIPVACVQCGKPYMHQKALEAIEAKLFSLDVLGDTFRSDARRSLLRMCPDCRAVVAMMEVDKGWEP